MMMRGEAGGVLVDCIAGNVAYLLEQQFITRILAAAQHSGEGVWAARHLGGVAAGE
jgi:hypothetical protein